MLPIPSQPSAVVPASVDLLDSAVALTRERERDALRASLLRTLGEMLPISEMRVQLADTPLPGPDANGAWHGLSLGGGEMEGRVLAVQLRSAEAGDAHILQGFIRLYRNFLAVIDESERDRLTSLCNRRAFDARIGAVCDKLSASPTAGKLWLVLLDIDHFKRINDGYGHLYGDEVLVKLAQLLRTHFPHRDSVFRYGGEEFALLLRADDAAAAREQIDALRSRVARERFPGVEHITLSAGFCAISARLAPPVLVERADRALYAAKEAGRNRVVAFEDIVHAAGPLAGAVELF